MSRLSEMMPKTVGTSLRVLAIILLPVAALAAYVGYLRFGVNGVAAALTAAVVCWMAGAAALLVTNATRNTPSALAGLMLSMLMRTGLPLLAATVLSNTVHELAEAGVFAFFVVFYLITLSAETLLSVGLLNVKEDSEKAN